VPAERFVTQLQEQIGYEFAASQQYAAAAVYYDGMTLPRLAAFFYAQALEERNHAMMMVRYLLDAGADVKVPGMADPVNEFSDVVSPVAIALEQEKKVSDQIAGLTRTAREEGDFQSEQFMGWFLKEQIEEVATMSELLHIVERCRDNVMLAEEYLAREHASTAGDDPTAPPVAGGAV
jgi:ferritin